MRLIGLLGILALVPVNIFGFVHAWQTRDVKGAALMLFMMALLGFFSLALWRGARLEREATRGKLAEGWAGEPVGAFFQGVVARTWEGRIYLIGSVLSVTFGALGLLWPEAVGMATAKAPAHAVMFATWPVASFVWYVKVCGPTYRTTASSVILVLMAVGVPFLVAYG